MYPNSISRALCSDGMRCIKPLAPSRNETNSSRVNGGADRAILGICADGGHDQAGIRFPRWPGPSEPFRTAASLNHGEQSGPRRGAAGRLSINTRVAVPPSSSTELKTALLCRTLYPRSGRPPLVEKQGRPKRIQMSTGAALDGDDLNGVCTIRVVRSRCVNGRRRMKPAVVNAPLTSGGHVGARPLTQDG